MFAETNTLLYIHGDGKEITTVNFRKHSFYNKLSTNFRAVINEVIQVRIRSVNHMPFMCINTLNH